MIYGGTQTGHSIRQIMQGCNILCATPGRLLDIIGKEKVRLWNLAWIPLSTLSLAYIGVRYSDLLEANTESRTLGSMLSLYWHLIQVTFSWNNWIPRGFWKCTVNPDLFTPFQGMLINTSLDQIGCSIQLHFIVK